MELCIKINTGVEYVIGTKMGYAILKEKTVHLFRFKALENLRMRLLYFTVRY